MTPEGNPKPKGNIINAYLYTSKYETLHMYSSVSRSVVQQKACYSRLYLVCLVCLFTMCVDGMYVTTGWALAAVTSRAFRVGGLSQPAACLPLIDMANHAGTPNAAVRPVGSTGMNAWGNHIKSKNTCAIIYIVYASMGTKTEIEQTEPPKKMKLLHRERTTYKTKGRQHKENPNT